MNFADAGFPVFLGLVFAIDVLLTSRPRSRPRFALRAVLGLLLADLLWVLVTRETRTLWDPFGAWVAHGLGGHPRHVDPARCAVGLALFVHALASGHHHGAALDGTVAQRWTLRLSALFLTATGIALLVAQQRRQTEALAGAFGAFAHLGFIALYGLALGASARSDTPARGVARLLHLFIASALGYQSWASTTPGAYRFLLALILATIVLDLWLALRIEALPPERPRARRALLIVSVVANLGVLALFKYYDFAAASLSALATALGLGFRLEPVALLLPAGISFHTFQSLSYTLEVYRGSIRATPSPLRFASFVLFFPQLVAGPIVRAETFLPQMEPGARPGLGGSPPACAQEGIPRILLGLAKKLCLADHLAVGLVDGVFANPGRFSALEVAAAAYGYAFQIYLDFSGYSDIAIGAAQLLGFTLPENFALPYRARTVSEFWRRWHISLSTWLRDFLYVPLGGSRDGDLRTYRNLFITMVLGGLWHGANWTFVAWGALHGGGLAAVRFFQRAAERGPIARRRAWRFATGVALVGAMTHGASTRGWAPALSPAWHLILGWCWLTPIWAATVTTLDARVRNDLRGAQRMQVRMAGMASTCLTFHYIVAAWIPFRASDFEHAAVFVAQLATFTTDTVNLRPRFVLALLVAMLAHAFGDPLEDLYLRAWRGLPAPLRALAVGLAALALSTLAGPAAAPFIYFQF